MRLLSLIAITCSILVWYSCRQPLPYTTWQVYRGDKASTGYSALNQIHTGNLDQLEVAWVYHCGDAREENRSAIQCNPIVIDNRMYITSPQLKLVALDAGTGKELWKFNPFVNEEATGVNRGVTYWEEGEDKRIFFSAGTWLYALDAVNGALITSFGRQGKVDLREGLGREPSALSVWATTPGIIYKNLLIQGTALGEGYDAAPGFVRAYDTRSGQIVWTFHTIPQPGEFGYDTWDADSYKQTGGVNCWAGMSLDEKKGMVYIPLGSPAFDFYGGNRKGQNLFGNCLVALNAATGKRVWHYQLVHHDLWDYDLPAPPVLLNVTHGGKDIEAVAQVTKMGMVFLFDRVTGAPVFPIEEKPVPASLLLGEMAWPTQPFPARPQPFVRQFYGDSDVIRISDSSYRYVSEKIKGAKKGSMYTPPDTAGVVQFPGTRGGAEWGGASVDPGTGILYVNANEVPLLIKMKAVSMQETGGITQGEKIYTLNNCTMCHGADRKGTPVYPSLLKLHEKYAEKQVSDLLQTGKGQMPAFPNLGAEDKKALIEFLFDRSREAREEARDTAGKNYRYVHNGWIALTDQNGYPGVQPPWGTLNAIDLNKGDILWQIPLGEYPELTKKGVPPTGTPNLGGAVVTAGGLVMIGATRDEKFRIFDKHNGKLLWEYQLPAGGYAMPATYMMNGKQYIVIAAGGGGKVGSPSGDAYVAFCLKK
ncbi:MAG: pyrroloquinoline quinone-dependent dehydrogenase [Chitinophagaceae bacterium]|nr:pyrroloquinoline quinone-dependent dehydrogenase [Chitinophagaceae bacterium]